MQAQVLVNLLAPAPFSANHGCHCCMQHENNPEKRENLSSGPGVPGKVGTGRPGRDGHRAPYFWPQ
jgi:hypothetical protein